MQLSANRRRAQRTSQVLIKRQARLSMTQAMETWADNACGEMGRRLLAGGWRTSAVSAHDLGTRRHQEKTNGHAGTWGDAMMLDDGVVNGTDEVLGARSHELPINATRGTREQAAAVTSGETSRGKPSAATVHGSLGVSRAADSAYSDLERSSRLKGSARRPTCQGPAESVSSGGALSHLGRAVLCWKAVVWPVSVCVTLADALSVGWWPETSRPSCCCRPVETGAKADANESMRRM
jgi:hypothetical protein